MTDAARQIEEALPAEIGDFRWELRAAGHRLNRSFDSKLRTWTV
jgi:hypothetical protein